MEVEEREHSLNRELLAPKQVPVIELAIVSSLHLIPVVVHVVMVVE